MRYVKIVAASAVAAAALAVTACSSTSSTSAPASSPSQSVSAPAAPAPASSTPAPAASAPAKPAAPAMTASQQQAVDSAQSYLQLGSGFSHYSLVQQLTSTAGDGFSTADAEFAVKYLHPDWNAQAVEAAKGYMKLGTGFSRSSLIEQLTSTAGDGFTQAQAEYAVSKVGL